MDCPFNKIRRPYELGGLIDRSMREAFGVVVLILATVAPGWITALRAPSPRISSGSAVRSSCTRLGGAPMHEGKAKANGITLAYESFGPADRETVLMIMGNGTQLVAWP